MKVHHVSCGTMCPFGKRLIEGHGSLLEAGTMCCHCLLIETNDGLVLVDSGLGLGDVRDGNRLGRMFLAVTRPKLLEEETAIRQVEKLGFSASDVRNILLTHLDLDHAGGIGDFPRATVHVHAKEHAAAMHPATMAESNRYRPAHWSHEPVWKLHETSGDRWYGFESVRALGGTDDEVLVIPTHGHTRGHSAIAVRTSSGWLLHAGDAYFFRGEVNTSEPPCPPGLRFFQSAVEVSSKDRHANQRRLRELVSAHGDEVTVFSAHDPVELARLQAS